MPKILGSTDTDVTADEFLCDYVGPRTIDHGNGITQEFDEDGNEFWYRNGVRHRDSDLPATVCADGAQYWYQNGLCHRDNDLPAIICSDGTMEWYRNGLHHRDSDKPAMILRSTQYWYQNGRLHRDGGKPVAAWDDTLNG